MSKLIKCLIAFIMLIGLGGCSKKTEDSSKKEETVKIVADDQKETKTDEGKAEIQKETYDENSQNDEENNNAEAAIESVSHDKSSSSNVISSNTNDEQISSNTNKATESKKNSTVSAKTNESNSKKNVDNSTSNNQTETSQSNVSKENTEVIEISQSVPATELEPVITPVSNNTDGAATVDQTTTTWGTDGFKPASSLSEAIDTNYSNNTVGGLDISIQLGEDDTCGLNGSVTFTLKGIRQELGNTETFGSKTYTINAGNSHVVIDNIPAGSYQIIVTSWPSQYSPNAYFYQVVNGTFTLNDVDTSSYIRDGNTNRKVWLVFN